MKGATEKEILALEAARYAAMIVIDEVALEK